MIDEGVAHGAIAVGAALCLGVAAAVFHPSLGLGVFAVGVITMMLGLMGLGVLKGKLLRRRENGD